MSQLDKMNNTYEQLKTEVQKNYSQDSEVRSFLDSDFTSALIEKVGLVFPFQYSGEDGIYYFGDLEAFKEYVMERLNDEGLIVSDDYYESSEEWEYSSC